MIGDVDLVGGDDLEWAASVFGFSAARVSIVRYVVARGEASVPELQEALGLSDTTLRWHLSHLAKAGLVTNRYVARPIGRPAQLWRVVPAEVDRLRAFAQRLI